jgi:transposase
LNGERYVEVLEDELLRSLEHLGIEPGEVLFQQDNARPHIAKVSLKWFEDHGIETLEWPSNSPDLNPIENLWAELKRRLGEYEHPPGGMIELWNRVQDIWDGFG